MNDNDEFILEDTEFETEDIIFDNSDDSVSYFYKQAEIIAQKEYKFWYEKAKSASDKGEKFLDFSKNSEVFYKTVEKLSKKNRSKIITWWVSWDKGIKHDRFSLKYLKKATALLNSPRRCDEAVEPDSNGGFRLRFPNEVCDGISSVIYDAISRYKNKNKLDGYDESKLEYNWVLGWICTDMMFLQAARSLQKHIDIENKSINIENSSGNIVYFIKSSDAIKIGTTNGNANKRLKELQTGNPENLILIGQCNGGVETEAMLHRVLGSYHKRGEWFRADPDLISIIELIINK